MKFDEYNHVTYYFSPFGLVFLDHLLIDARARSSKSFSKQRTALSRMCADYLRDVTYCNLMFTNRNVTTHTEHIHLKHAQTRLKERLRQSFCSECDEETCFVNVHMQRVILVHLYYVSRVRVILTFVLT